MPAIPFFSSGSARVRTTDVHIRTGLVIPSVNALSEKGPSIRAPSRNGRVAASRPRTSTGSYTRLGESKRPEAIQKVKNCAHFVPKICQEYQNESKDIEIHRNPECQKNGLFSLAFIYFLHFKIFPASCTRVKSEFQVLYCPPFKYVIIFNL